jgi:membrane AbrB-like protein
MSLSLFPFFDILLLFFLGFCGCVIFKLLHLPVAPLLGTITVIGILRAAGFSLPVAPDYLSPVTQVILGLSVGSRIKRETLYQLKEMIFPALIIISWALAAAFLLGAFLSKITDIEPFTAILSCSMGGLPEMTMIALATNAEVTVVIIMQTFRMVATTVSFPFMMSWWAKRESLYFTGVLDKKGLKNPGGGEGEEESEEKKEIGDAPQKEIALPGKKNCSAKKNVRCRLQALFNLESKGQPVLYKGQLVLYMRKILFPLIIAGTGGALFVLLGVPAGAMIGSMFFVTMALLAGVDIPVLPPPVFTILFIGIGIIVSNNISSETLELFISGQLMLPIIILTFFAFISSLLVAYLISRINRWDFLTCFLAAAPGGFSVMTALAVNSGKDPFRVSVLHLCRLISLKTVIPLVFMFFL